MGKGSSLFIRRQSGWFLEAQSFISDKLAAAQWLSLPPFHPQHVVVCGVIEVRISPPAMDYALQQQYMNRSRLQGCGLALILVAMATLSLVISAAHSTRAAVAFCICIAALAISLCYSPDYLHLTVNAEKKASWEIKIRWRLAAAVLFLGAPMAGNVLGIVLAATAAAWLAGANLLALPNMFQHISGAPILCCSQHCCWQHLSTLCFARPCSPQPLISRL